MAGYKKIEFTQIKYLPHKPFHQRPNQATATTSTDTEKNKLLTGEF